MLNRKKNNPDYFIKAVELQFQLGLDEVSKKVEDLALDLYTLKLQCVTNKNLPTYKDKYDDLYEKLTEVERGLPNVRASNSHFSELIAAKQATIDDNFALLNNAIMSQSSSFATFSQSLAQYTETEMVKLHALSNKHSEIENQIIEALNLTQVDFVAIQKKNEEMCKDMYDIGANFKHIELKLQGHIIKSASSISSLRASIEDINSSRHKFTRTTRRAKLTRKMKMKSGDSINTQLEYMVEADAEETIVTNYEVGKSCPARLDSLSDRSDQASGWEVASTTSKMPWRERCENFSDIE